MYMKGISVTRNNNLGWRYGDPAKDKDTYGKAVESNYVSFVRIKDCELYKEEGRQYYNPKNAPCIPIGHGGTYYGYGLLSIRKNERGIYIDGEYQNNYQQVTVYFVKDSIVYSGSIQKPLGDHTFNSIFSEKRFDANRAKNLLKKLLELKVQVNEYVLESAIRQNCYEWFEPYLNQLSASERDLYEGYKLKNLVKNN